MEEIIFNKEGKKRLKDIWDHAKVSNLDFSGWSFNYACKRAKEFGIDVGMAYGFKGLTGDALHTYAEIYDGDDICVSQTVGDGTRSKTQMIKILEKHLSPKLPELSVTIVGESNSLEKREEIINLIVKLPIINEKT